MVGDFNGGIALEDSETRTFICTHLFQELLRQGWVDSWRRRHPREREFSWFSQSKATASVMTTPWLPPA
jgi:exonuclease III